MRGLERRFMFRRMLRTGAVVVLAAFTAGLSGCGARERADASESAGRLLAAAEAGDRAAFEGLIDRAAVREDLRRQIAEVARAGDLEVDGGPSDFALDRRIGPAAVRHALAGDGVAAVAPEEIAERLKAMGRDRACLPDAADGRCLLTFARTRDGWRLVGLRAMDLSVELAGANPPG